METMIASNSKPKVPEWLIVGDFLTVRSYKTMQQPNCRQKSDNWRAFNLRKRIERISNGDCQCDVPNHLDFLSSVPFAGRPYRVCDIRWNAREMDVRHRSVKNQITMMDEK